MGKPSKTDNGNNSLEKKDMTRDSSAMKGYMEREIFFILSQAWDREVFGVPERN